MSVISLPEAKPEARSRPDEQALIAEARAHARRRRRKAALALVIVAVTASAGALIARAVASTRHAAPPRSRAELRMTLSGIVTGHLAACFGAPPMNGPLPVTPGTVVAWRGRITWKPDGPGSWRLVLPAGPVVARAHISNNDDQAFRFALPPGHYLLAGSYDTGSGYRTFHEVTVIVGKVIRDDLPNMCM